VSHVKVRRRRQHRARARGAEGARRVDRRPGGDAPKRYDEIDLTLPTAVVVGAEGTGCGGWCVSGATGWCRSRCRARRELERARSRPELFCLKGLGSVPRRRTERSPPVLIQSKVADAANQLVHAPTCLNQLGLRRWHKTC
jgi:hypothetical protein